MAAIEVQLKGAEQFRRLAERMRHLPQHVHDALSTAILEEADLLGTTAHKKAPVDTGRLRESYTHRLLTSRQGVISVLASYEAPYASFPHDKTHWGKGSKKGMPGAAYPNHQWFLKAAQAVAKGLIGRVVRKVRPVLKALYAGQGSPVH